MKIYDLPNKEFKITLKEPQLATRKCSNIISENQGSNIGTKEEV